MGTQPLLSIGLIIKNEIRCIERCMKSLEPLRAQIPCEVVIADTGSTDGSREIAARYADILFDFAWCNDFSAARNAVLERCTGRWFFSLDADEWLDDSCQVLSDFLQSGEQERFDCGKILVRNYQNKSYTDYTETYLLRFGNLQKGRLRFASPIHEYLTFEHLQPQEMRGFLMKKMIVYHDGYVAENSHIMAQKKHRNMQILRQKLKDDPRDLQTICYCITSAENNYEKVEYVNHLRQVVVQEDSRHPYVPVSYQHCLRVYREQGAYQESLLCLEEGLSRRPDSYLLRVDGQACVAWLAYSGEKYGETLEHGEKWFSAIQDVEKGLDLDQPERQYSGYSFFSPLQKGRLLGALVDAGVQEGQYAFVDRLLEALCPQELEHQVTLPVITQILSGGAKLANAGKALNWIWEAAGGKDRDGADDADEFTAQILRTMEEKLDSDDEAAALEALAQMDGAPGQAARILLADRPEEILWVWNTVTEWDKIFPQAYLKTMERNIDFPARFYSLQGEVLYEIVARMAGEASYCRVVSQWFTQVPKPQALCRVVWELSLLTALFRQKDWEQESDERKDKLYARYFALAGEFMDQIYRMDKIEAEEISVLPGTHRFYWYCCRALQAKGQGRMYEYVALLRQALHTAPAMKQVVSDMLKAVPDAQESASPQLLELAEKVRAILAQYPPDDPAVAALKQSEAYQRVAYLIEGLDAPAFGGLPQ